MKKSLQLLFLISSVSALAYWFWLRGQNPTSVLRIYTYSSLSASWGAGPLLIEEFTKQCQCKVHLVDVKEGGVLLQRLLLERGNPQTDLILGLDQPRLRYAANHLEFKKLPADWLKEMGAKIRSSPIAPFWIINEQFMAFDWAPLAFVARDAAAKVNLPPASLIDFLQSNTAAWVLPNPRTSTVGLGFLIWLVVEAGDHWPQVLQHAKIKTLSASWSQSYALFQKKQFPLALAYATSPLYHQLNENDSSINFIKFIRHAPHIEYAAVPESCKNCDLAVEFLKFLMSEQAQQILWRHNYMLPVILGNDSKPELHSAATLNLVSTDLWFEAIKNQDVILEKWDSVVGSLGQ